MQIIKSIRIFSSTMNWQRLSVFIITFLMVLETSWCATESQYRSQHNSNSISKRAQRPQQPFSPVKMPTDFKTYDLNGDGYLSAEEIAEVTGAKELLSKAFNDADRDADGRLSPEEFRVAPWKLDGNFHLEMRRRRRRY